MPHELPDDVTGASGREVVASGRERASTAGADAASDEASDAISNAVDAYITALSEGRGQVGDREAVGAFAPVETEGAVVAPRAHPYAASAQFVEDLTPAPRPPRRPARLPWWWNPFAHLVLLAILAYQTCIPLERKRRCIFTPSCSRYCQAAIKQYGLARGVVYFWGRFRRCNEALSRGGYDPP